MHSRLLGSERSKIPSPPCSDSLPRACHPHLRLAPGVGAFSGELYCFIGKSMITSNTPPTQFVTHWGAASGGGSN